MMQNNLISVIMPTYNAGGFILLALNAVKAQTYTSWEIIIVDDGSQDNTEAVVNDFIKTVENNRIQYIKCQENGGVAAARNLALKHAQGAYIAFLDSDDYWSEDHLSTGVAALQEKQIDVVYSSVQTFKDNPLNIVEVEKFSQWDLDSFPVSLLITNNPIYPTSVIMKRAIVDRVELFDSSLKMTSDADFLIRVAAAGYKFLYLDTLTAFLRRGHRSLSSNQVILKEYFTKTIRKNLHANIGTRKERYEIASMWHLAVAKDNLHKDPLKTAKFLFTAWRMRPAKLKYIAGIFFALFLFFKKSFLSIPSAETQ